MPPSVAKLALHVEAGVPAASAFAGRLSAPAGAKGAVTGPMAAGAKSAVLFISASSGLAKKKPDVSSTKRSPTTPAAVSPPKM